MIEQTQGDILKADAEALVNTVNCVGVMGRGIALQFKKKFPDNYNAYKSVCDRKQLYIGKMHVHNRGRLYNPKYIINFPTKRHWKGKSKMEDIEAGLKALVNEVNKNKIHSVAIPPLGCGLGGLKWEDVKRKIIEAFQNIPDVRILLYEPIGSPAVETMVKTYKKPNMTRGRAALLGLMRRYLAAVMDPIVTLLEIHKLMYFLQEAGEDLNLRYKKATYGPYAENLRHVLSVMEGHFISGYGDAEDRPDKQIELKANIIDKAEAFLKTHPQTLAHFKRVEDLIEGFESPLGMELLATVHWVSKHENVSTVDEAVKKIYAWSNRKKMFREKHIRIVWDALDKKGWLASV